MARGWLTPDFPPEHRFYQRQLLIPATAEFLGLVNGALVELCLPHNWEQSGEMTPFETADYFTVMWEQYTHNLDEPPDWETPDDLDGQPEQPWYEDLADWIIQGFLAVTFTPEAAIVYQATVPKLRVAIRTGNLGALFRVLINGVEVWTGDSYDAITDLLEHTFDMSAETEPYTVRIEHAGIGEGHGLTEAKLEVVRGEAVADMVATILRADPEGCGIQWSTDDGGTWSTIDLATCINEIANGAIGQAIDDGKLATPGQQPTQGTPDPGECVSYHVTLQGNGKWYCPSPVNSGDTITVTNAVGAWYDGDILNLWACPDGTNYVFGTCGSENDPVETDPFNTAPHMCLIGKVVSTYFDAIRDGYTVPAGTVDQALIMQANDDPLNDNAGSIEFDVEICASSGWCYIWDFTDNDQGFANVDGAGTNWDVFGGVNQWGAPQIFDISKTIETVDTGNVTSLQIDYHLFGPRTMQVQLYDNDTSTLILQDNITSGAGNTAVSTVEIPSGHSIIVRILANDAGGVSIENLILRGDGANPIGESNC